MTDAAHALLKSHRAPAWSDRLYAPIVAAPMYLVTTPALVIAACEGGIAAVIPALNAEDARQLDGWLGEIAASVHGECAGIWGVTLVCHSPAAT
jgi:nitronate monooxygenase